MQRKVVWKPEAPGFPSLVRHIKAEEKKNVALSFKFLKLEILIAYFNNVL